jgi:hypothetical protein
MNLEISPSQSYVWTLHEELLDALEKVFSLYKALEDVHSQLSAIHSGQSWLREQGEPMSEQYKVEHELVFLRCHLTQLIDVGYYTLKDLIERFGDLQSDPL